jgi:hypothetical protein
LDIGRALDLTGQRFGILTVLERAEDKVYKKRKRVCWLCRCDCGKEKIIAKDRLMRGDAKSCGCLRGKDKFIDLTGQRFGKLVVLEVAFKDKYKIYQWKCICDCGNETIVSRDALKSGKTRSCGCLHIPDLIGERFGRLIVKELMGVNKHGGSTWLCFCDCGKEKPLREVH